MKSYKEKKIKTYTVKFDVGQEIYLITDKKIIKTKIERIKIEDRSPFKEIASMTKDSIDIKERTGLTINYLVTTHYEENASYHDWFLEDDIALTQDELIQKIT